MVGVTGNATRGLCLCLREPSNRPSQVLPEKNLGPHFAPKFLEGSDLANPASHYDNSPVKFRSPRAGESTR
jgi:hypothetical protein